ncbi:hypothetical protein HZB89_00790 [archaeon]|nr:hypothetical protein [archaeon]
MGHVNNFFQSTKKAIPLIAARIGAFLLFIFALGMFFGYFIALKGPNEWFWLLGPVAAMIVTWQKLDEGYLLFFLLLLLAVFL